MPTFEHPIQTNTGAGAVLGLRQYTDPHNNKHILWEFYARYTISDEKILITRFAYTEVVRNLITFLNRYASPCDYAIEIPKIGKAFGHSIKVTSPYQTKETVFHFATVNHNQVIYISGEYLKGAFSDLVLSQAIGAI